MKIITFSIIIMNYIMVLLSLTQIESVKSYVLDDTLPDGRIVGGVATTIFQFPHQISLRYQNRHRCGGSIIAQNIILTAAHCVVGVNKDRMIVRAGTTYKDSPGTDIKISRIIVHEGYHNDGQDNDIAIIILQNSLTFSERIRAIDLDDNTNAVDIKKTGTVAFVSGWGASKEGGSTTYALNYASVLIVSQDSCSKSYYPTKITKGMICAGLLAGGRDSCQGDSGGPLIVYNNKSPVLIGVVSWGNGCARPGYPGVYARVSEYRAWINRRVNLKDTEIKIGNKI